MGRHALILDPASRGALRMDFYVHTQVFFTIFPARNKRKLQESVDLSDPCNKEAFW